MGNSHQIVEVGGSGEEAQARGQSHLREGRVALPGGGVGAWREQLHSVRVEERTFQKGRLAFLSSYHLQAAVSFE